MKKAVLFFGLLLSLAAVGIGQIRTVTNSSLRKFQQSRLKAESNYRDNYARLGFPSPEELDRQRDADMVARIKLAEQLRHSRLEKERLEIERHNFDLQAAAIDRERERDNDGRYYNGT
ncbi:MAG: hypothetical protein ABJB34_11225, partial [Acidobacteriota bacterium]